MERIVSTAVGFLLLLGGAKLTGWVSRWLQRKVPALQIVSRYRVLELIWLVLIFIPVTGLLIVAGMGVLWLAGTMAQLFQ